MRCAIDVNKERLKWWSAMQVVCNVLLWTNLFWRRQTVCRSTHCGTLCIYSRWFWGAKMCICLERRTFKWLLSCKYIPYELRSPTKAGLMCTNKCFNICYMFCRVHYPVLHATLWHVLNAILGKMHIWIGFRRCVSIYIYMWVQPKDMIWFAYTILIGQIR